MKINKLLLAAFAGSLFFVSCSSDDDSSSDEPKGNYDNGVLILNEGGFQQGNSTISFLSKDDVLQNNIFSIVNNADLGDTGQDIGLNGEYAYIVVNNSHKIEVANRYTMEKLTTITSGLDNPRYIAFENNRGYVTNWGDPFNTQDDFVAVIDLSTNTVTATIPVAEGPERIIEENGKLYVAHKGGYGYGNTISVINAANNTLAATLTVGDVPDAIEEENGKLYVMSEGKSVFSGDETGGRLTVINLSDNSVAATYNFAETSHPANMVIEDEKLYYTIDSDIYVMNLTDSTLPDAPLFSIGDQGVYGIYAFEVEDDRIYIGDAVDYSSNGKVYIYSLTGTLQNTYTVGVTPTGFYFND